MHSVLGAEPLQEMVYLAAGGTVSTAAMESSVLLVVGSAEESWVHCQTWCELLHLIQH